MPGGDRFAPPKSPQREAARIPLYRALRLAISIVLRCTNIAEEVIGHPQ
jgi:hypothetical protein